VENEVVVVVAVLVQWVQMEQLLLAGLAVMEQQVA
jgi:hypothetical protein